MSELPNNIKSPSKEKFTFGAAMRCAGKGVRIAAGHRNFRIDLIFAWVALILGFALHITRIEWIAVVLCIGLVLAAETFNTAIEYVVDLVTLDHHELAGKAKDCAAGACLLCAGAALVVGCLVFIPRLWMLFLRFMF